MSLSSLLSFARHGLRRLKGDDPRLYELLDREHRRQQNTLVMVAASSIADPSVIACEGTSTSNVTTEGYPGRRFHAGCEFVDEIERLAIARAKEAFGALYANVQPHSGSSANEIVLFSLLQPGDSILGLDLNSGGHLTHGAPSSVSGQHFRGLTYGLSAEGRIDYDQAERIAEQTKPRVIVAGASAYPRAIDFSRFRRIADSVGAYLLADISHIAGLVVAGVHANPINDAHFTTTSTYKQLYGPRGGLILMGKDADQAAPRGKGTLANSIQRAVFPFFQGTPSLNVIAAKARALAMVQSPEFKSLARRIVRSARALAECFQDRGYRVLTGGTDNHMVFLDVAARGLSGVIAEQALQECNIIVNKNRIPGDSLPATVASGMRLGTNTMAIRGLDEAQMTHCAALVDQVLRSLEVRGPSEYLLAPSVRDETRQEVIRLCREFPLPHYAAESEVKAPQSLYRPVVH